MASQGLKISTLRHVSDFPQDVPAGRSLGWRRRHYPEVLGVGNERPSLPAKGGGSL